MDKALMPLIFSLIAFAFAAIASQLKLQEAETEWLDFQAQCEQVQHGKAVRQHKTGEHVCVMPQPPRGRVDSGQAEAP